MRNLGYAALMAGIGMMAGSAEGAFITYTTTVTGSGSLGSASFVDRLVTLTVTADTANVVTFPGGTRAVLAAPARVSVAGVGTGTFLEQVTITVTPTTTENFFLYQGSPMGGGGPVILGQQVEALVGYDFASQVGPVAGAGTTYFNRGLGYQTSGGNFTLLSTSGNVSFAASVPEPSSLALCGVSMGLGAVWVRRRAA